MTYCQLDHYEQQFNENENTKVLLHENTFVDRVCKDIFILVTSECDYTLAPVRFEWNLEISNLQANLLNDGWRIFCDATLRWVNFASGNGLVPPGNNPLPEPMLTQSYDAKTMMNDSQFGQTSMRLLSKYPNFSSSKCENDRNFHQASMYYIT